MSVLHAWSWKRVSLAGTVGIDPSPLLKIRVLYLTKLRPALVLISTKILDDRFNNSVVDSFFYSDTTLHQFEVEL